MTTIGALAFPELEPLRAHLAPDAELTRAARQLTGTRSRQRTGASPRGAARAPVGPRDLQVRATPEQWAKLLAPLPEAFYQDVVGAAAQHGVGFGGDVETMYAYYPALRRVLDILRDARS